MALPFSFQRLAGGTSRAIVASIALLGVAAVAASVWVAPGVPGWLGAALALIMLAIAVIDARLFIIPNELSAAGFALGLLNAAATAPEAVWQAAGFAALRGVVLALLFLGLRAGYRKVRGRDGIGLGDVKLAAVAGAWLSWLILPIVVEIAALAAIAVFVLRHYVAGRPLDTALKFPFGLFLAPCIWLGWFIEATLLWPP